MVQMDATLNLQNLPENLQQLMSDQNQERIARATKAKQAYLRQHIPAADYEDFGEFCQETVGNTVIEGWSLEFVIELVDKFKKKLAQRKEQEQRQPQEKQPFYVYQTGKSHEMKQLAQQIKQQQQQNHSKPQPQQPNFKKPPPRPASRGKEQSALEVLDSIFKNQKQSQFTSNKYDKSVFQSRNFWDVNGQEESKQKQAEKQAQNMLKKNQRQTAEFTSNKFPLEPEKFEQIFTTGLKLPDIKNEDKQISPKPKKYEQASISKPTQTSPKGKKQEDPYDKVTVVDAVRTKVETNGNSNKGKDKNENNNHNIKLLSVKSLNSSKLPFEGEILFPQSFRQSVTCFKSFQRHALSLKGLSVNIANHEIVNRSFFSSDYVMYHLHVTPTNIVCKRNLQDFQKLRKNLQSMYPGVRVPYIEKVGLFGSETTPQNIEKQKKYLTYFLNDLLNHKQLKNFCVLQDFLTLKDHKQMKRKFQEYDKMKKITAIQQLCLLEDTVKIDISEPTRQYNQLLETFTTRLKDCWGAQDRILTQIHDLHRKIADSYRELAQVIETGIKEAQQFNRRVSLSQIDSLDAAFQNLMRYTNENIKMNEKECDLIRNEFLARIRYQRENMSTLDSVADVRNNLTRSYLKRRESEKSSDTLEYSSERLKEFKTSIIEQSKSFTVLKYQCGYINQLMMAEGHNFFTLLAQKVCTAVGNACFSKIQTYPNILSSFSELVLA